MCGACVGVAWVTALVMGWVSVFGEGGVAIPLVIVGVGVGEKGNDNGDGGVGGPGGGGGDAGGSVGCIGSCVAESGWATKELEAPLADVMEGFFTLEPLADHGGILALWKSSSMCCSAIFLAKTLLARVFSARVFGLLL